MINKDFQALRIVDVITFLYYTESASKNATGYCALERIPYKFPSTTVLEAVRLWLQSSTIRLPLFSFIFSRFKDVFIFCIVWHLYAKIVATDRYGTVIKQYRQNWEKQSAEYSSVFAGC